jgi:hypothetical protein
METIFPLVLPVADAASATIMRRASELLRVIAKLSMAPIPAVRQKELSILPSRLKAGHEPER